MPHNLATDIVIREDSKLPRLDGIAPISEAELKSVAVGELEGLWPGIRRPPTVDGRGDETASASREPWVDANGYQAGYLRALYPNRAPVLAYLPDKLGDRSVPYDSLELALIEAWVAGGNYVLAVEPHYREALERKDPKAVAAWEQLGRTARWLKQNIALFRQPAVPIVTALVEPGVATAEIANLLYRRNVSPALAAVTAIPAPDPSKRLALVAANLKPPPPETVKRILAHAEAGTTLVVATMPTQQWWKVAGLKQVREDKDRDFFTLGKGQVVAYRRPIADPSEFALDVIDIITHKQRAVRLWNAPAVIALVTGERMAHLVNYGSPIDMDIQARVQGHFSKATLLRPDGEPVALKVAKRGSTTEVEVPELRRLGVLVFS
ncbi:MAG TPA: hypothetical protein VEX68_04420 [Bryobacteraceae bacterium]|nr:hypothetical protein [Bryobacteraceae bacterium]